MVEALPLSGRDEKNLTNSVFFTCSGVFTSGARRPAMEECEIREIGWNPSPGKTTANRRFMKSRNPSSLRDVVDSGYQD
jgi:hypothetical protein